MNGVLGANLITQLNGCGGEVELWVKWIVLGVVILTLALVARMIFGYVRKEYPWN